MVSLGCCKNLVDAEEMLAQLQQAGWQIASDPSEALAIVVNTCGFLESAKQEAIDAIFDMAAYRETGDCRVLAVTGCLAQRYPKELMEEIPEIDVLLGVANYLHIAAALDEALAKEGARVCLHDALPATYHGSDRLVSTPAHWAYLKIAEGCDNCCSYCAIPSIRGPYRSRPMAEIVCEAQRLADAGVRELIVVAQDTTRYGQDLPERPTLHMLLEALCAIEGVAWVRVLYAYPEMVDNDLLALMAREPKLCKYLDIPIQHCNDAVLSAMNRRIDKAGLVELIQRVRALDAAFVLRTTIIAGFPGETDAQHQELLAFLQAHPFDRLGVFAYSQEEGTVAGEMPGQVPEDIRQKRLDAIMRQQQKISRACNAARIGCEYVCVVDGYDAGRHMLLMRSMYEAPQVDGMVLVPCSGDFVPTPGMVLQVRITDALDYDLVGELA